MTHQNHGRSFISSAFACVCQHASPQWNITRLKTRGKERGSNQDSNEGGKEKRRKRRRSSGGRADDKDKWVWGSYSPLHSFHLSLEEYCYSIQKLADVLCICSFSMSDRKPLETNISLVRATWTAPVTPPNIKSYIYVTIEEVSVVSSKYMNVLTMNN